MVGLERVKSTMAELRNLVEFDMWRKRFFGREKSLLGQAFHMQFLGNPGTGKTHVGRIIGKLLVQMEVICPQDGCDPSKEKETSMEEVTRPDLVAQYSGQTALKVKATVERNLGGVLFIDEAYSLVQDGRDSFGVEAVDTLIAEMENHRKHLIVILAGYEAEMTEFFKSNPGFKSRVPFTFHFDDYHCEELESIGRIFLKGNQMALPKEDG